MALRNANRANDPEPGRKVKRARETYILRFSKTGVDLGLLAWNDDDVNAFAFDACYDRGVPFFGYFVFVNDGAP